MNVDLFDFDLPDTHIALRPLIHKEQAKLLHVDEKSHFNDHHILDLAHLLQPGDALVFNDTKVIASSLDGRRQRKDEGRENSDGLPIRINLHQRTGLSRWLAFARPARRLRVGDNIIFSHEGGGKAEILTSVVLAKREGGEIELEFDRSSTDLDTLIQIIGRMPLPPYIVAKRVQDAQDEHDYQTIFAVHPGAVAAPTAGLHFTPRMLTAFHNRGITSHFITLHVGAGTFLPVKAADTQQHKMHFEQGIINEKTAANLNEIKDRGGRIIAVGTTVLRLLESAASPQGQIAPWSGATDIFITPGYKFRFVDQLVTNFHLPRSTLFMLVCAFSGLTTMQQAYQHAIAHHYRFYSYGDACLLCKSKENSC